MKFKSSYLQPALSESGDKEAESAAAAPARNGFPAAAAATPPPPPQGSPALLAYRYPEAFTVDLENGCVRFGFRCLIPGSEGAGTQFLYFDTMQEDDGLTYTPVYEKEPLYQPAQEGEWLTYTLANEEEPLDQPSEEESESDQFPEFEEDPVLEPFSFSPPELFYGTFVPSAFTSFVGDDPSNSLSSSSHPSSPASTSAAPEATPPYTTPAAGAEGKIWTSSKQLEEEGNVWIML